MAEIDSFWTWVCTRRAHDNPRGDFIHDARCLVDAGVDPSTRLVGACREAREEHDRLRRQYEGLGDGGGSTKTSPRHRATTVRCSFCGARAVGTRDGVGVCERLRCIKLFNRAVDRELAAFDAARRAKQDVSPEEFRCEDYL